jgi:hypothetical protein
MTSNSEAQQLLKGNNNDNNDGAYYGNSNVHWRLINVSCDRAASGGVSSQHHSSCDE